MIFLFNFLYSRLTNNKMTLLLIFILILSIIINYHTSRGYPVHGLYGITIAKDSDNTKTVSFNEAKKLKNEKLMTNPGKTKSKNNPFKDKFKKELIYTEGANLKNKKEKKKMKLLMKKLF